MILERSLLREHVAPFLASFFVITFLFALNYVIGLLDSVLSKGLPFGLLLEVMVLSLAWMVALSFPMSFLVASLMAFGRLSADNEITALRSAGVAPFKMMRPVLAVTLLASVLLILFNNWVLPEANHRAGSLLASISRKKPQAFISEGQLLKQFPGTQIWIDRIDQESGRLYGIQVWEIENRQTPRIVLADSGWIEYADQGATILLHLQSGWNHMRDDREVEKYFRVQFEQQTVAVKNIDDQFQRQERNRGDREMAIEEMLKVVEKTKAEILRLDSTLLLGVWGDYDRVMALLKKRDQVEEEIGLWNIQRVSPESWLKIHQEELNRQRPLRAAGISIHREMKRKAQYQVEIHKKFSLPVSCLLFVLVGAPLGIVARRGGVGTGAIYSIAFFVIYWVGLTSGEHLADRLIVSPVAAMWLPNLVIGLAGVYFTCRMMRDLPLVPAAVSRFAAKVKVLLLNAAILKGLKRVKGGGAEPS